MGFEEEIEDIAPEAFFDYLKESWDAVNSLIGDLIVNIKVAIANANEDERAKADALKTLGQLLEALVVTTSHIRDINVYVDHDTSKLSDLFVKVAKGLLVVHRYLKDGRPLREIEADLGDLMLDVNIFIGDMVRHAIEKAAGPQEAHVAVAAQGSSA
jgi:hypothetical protein